jgi:pimeloyl-ACP methyl ester carboxylesterase
MLSARKRGIASAVLAVVVAVVAQPGTAMSSHVAVRPAPVHWGSCDPSPASRVPGGQGMTARPDAARLQCTRIRVPLDYRRPAGRDIEIAVSRLPAANHTGRRGVLLLNPGGPGGAGLAYPLEFAASAPHHLLDVYDVVGFDPRGVGQSAPVSCGLSFDQALKATAPWPLPDGVGENADLAAQVARQCAQHSGTELPFITTANTARDMDRIRMALGERVVSFYGISYGTVLGAAYASLFPQNTDRMVLDSATDATRLWREAGFRVLGPGAEERFPDFAGYVASRDSTYHLGTATDQIRAEYFALAAKLDHAALQTPSGPLTGNLFRSATVLAALYSDELFAVTAHLWQAVHADDARTAGQIGDSLGMWNVSGFDRAAENSAAADLAVICDDAAWPRSIQVYQRDVRRDARRYPIAGALAANILPCAFWPTQPIEPPVRITSHGPANVLIVNNLRDPATPYFGALALRNAFGQRAHLVAVDQGGHGVYPNANICGKDTVTNYITSGTMPPDGTRCPSRLPRPQATRSATGA